MTEREARDATSTRVSRETFISLERFVAIVETEARQQNLMSPTTLAQIWSRHILDSIQLIPLIAGSSVDVGTGAGPPGLILAIAGIPITLVETRRLRASFLARCIAELGIDGVALHGGPAAGLRSRFDTITARAVASLDRLFEMTVHLAHPTSRWVLPKGRTVHEELEVARRAWHGRFELVPSITDPSAMIVVAEQLMPKASR